MSRTPFDDMEDPAFAPGGVAASPERAEQVAAAVEAAATLMNWEVCPKCRGSRKFTSRSGRVLGDCFACKGEGRVKPGYARRSAAAAKGRATAEVNKRMAGDAAIERFHKEFPAEWEWVRKGIERGDQFAEAMRGKIREFGSLTDNQMAAIRNSIAKAAERKVAVEIDVTGLDAAFAQARANGAKRASLRTEHVTFSLAGSNSANPGAVYAKARSGGDYLGKIIGGKFSKSFACTPAHVEQIVEAARDPKGAALRYAQITGECSVCGAELTDKNSIAAGIGPVCASKFGW